MHLAVKEDMSMQQQACCLIAAGGLQDKRQVRKQPGLAGACLTGESTGTKALQDKHSQRRSGIASGTGWVQDDQSGSPSASTADSSPVMTAAAIRGHQEQAQDNDASELQVCGTDAGCNAHAIPARDSSLNAVHTKQYCRTICRGIILDKGLPVTCVLVWARHDMVVASPWK